MFLIVILLFFSGVSVTYREDQAKSFDVSFDLSQSQMSFSCSSCKYSCSNVTEYKAHCLTHGTVLQHEPYLLENDRPFSCDVCQKAFKCRSHLKAHMVTHTKERPYQCAICFKSFGLKWNLRTHMITHQRDMI